ncbi:hypothetical protein BB561_006798 [Smittium simulii]|uniref:Uncharacterized protein n=1 Tax=Smittium simulii TaxID=133385 RepID=A0A2T9Y1E9_9FUNG|nr:hypothetical protein BB561_006798 [Smittium simulii]
MKILEIISQEYNQLTQNSTLKCSKKCRKNFEALNDLTEKVKFLYIKRKKQRAQQAQDMEVQNIECDNPHEKVRVLMVEMKILEIINQEYNQLTQSMHTPENSGQMHDYNNKLVHQYTTYSKNKNINGKQPITQSQT